MALQESVVINSAFYFLVLINISHDFFSWVIGQLQEFVEIPNEPQTRLLLLRQQWLKQCTILIAE